MSEQTPEVHAPTLFVNDAHLRYQTQLLFHNLNAVFEGGHCTGILGPSGVGKSSLLRLIAGLLPQQPHAKITTDDGLPLADRVGYLAQDACLLPWLTVFENVLLGYRLRGAKVSAAVTAQAERLFAEVQLTEQIQQYPNTLSGGQRQRAALVRLLIEDKPIILLDEPFASVDVITRLRLQELTARLFAKRTVILVTHDPLEALRLCHRIHVMQGQPAQLDEALEMVGLPPRPVTDLKILELQGELLRRLAKGVAV